MLERDVSLVGRLQGHRRDLSLHRPNDHVARRESSRSYARDCVQPSRVFNLTDSCILCDGKPVPVSEIFSGLDLNARAVTV